MNNLTKKKKKRQSKLSEQTPPGKMYRWQTSIRKGAKHHVSVGNYKSKQQWTTTMHLLKWPKSKTLKTPNAGEDVEQQEFSFMVGENAKGHRSLWEVVFLLHSFL